MKQEFDETSTALMTAAHEILDADGPEALTVRRIASQAGMSTMNVYSRFGGKDGVIDELYVYGYNKLFDAIEQVDETDDALDDLRRVAIAYRTFATEHPMYYDFNADLELSIDFDGIQETVTGRTLFEKMMFR